MKYFKYIAILLLVAIMGACDEKDVSYMAEPVDESSYAYVQIGYYAPVTAGAANYMYYIGLNDVAYGNNGSTFLATFNAIPSGGVNRYYVVPAGNLNLKMFKKDSTMVYNQNVDVAAGQHYCLFVHDLDKAPAVMQMDEVPAFGSSLDTDSLCHVQFVNMLYEADGTPITDKVQFGVQNLDTQEYEPVSEPVAFGECTPWFLVNIRKTVYNSSGSQRRNVCLYRIDANTGENLGKIIYTKSNGSTGEFTDYWTWYIGRGYREVAAGNLSSSTIRCALYQFTIQ